ncbi:hypothetical protein BDN67DRAFT_691455 [Paxillus ammoniavirescens]|nr:hypothetical protein BDN67DRAFT_691455 [Paxillus ammoniavirescens]
MPPLLPDFSSLIQLAEVQAASTNATSESPTPDATSCSYRSVWSILATCALTLLVCIWNAVYPSVIAEKRWYTVALYRMALGLTALIAPEFTAMRAYEEWRAAGKIQKEFCDHPWAWTRTHGFFALMGGFVLQDGARQTVLESRDELGRLRDERIRIVNPNITTKEIHGRSKSDALGNTILVLQLSWFILQVIARAANHLAITLLEVDTLALAALSLPLFFFWWNKPVAPEFPHIFYLSNTTMPQHGPEMFSYGQEPLLQRGRFPTFVTSYSSEISHRWDDDVPVYDTEIDWQDKILGKGQDNSIWVLFIVWVIFGALHLIAWDFQFPSPAEKTMWHVASLTLIGAPCIFFLGWQAKFCVCCCMCCVCIPIVLVVLAFGFVARIVLLVLMFASLRDLPTSAYHTVPWTTYIPHL